MPTPSTMIRRSALFLLLTFLIGGVVSPVMAHAFHPHVVPTGSDDAAETVGTMVIVDAPDACVLCDAAMPADVSPQEFAVPIVSPGLLVTAAAVVHLQDARPDRSARGPPC